MIGNTECDVWYLELVSSGSILISIGQLHPSQGGGGVIEDEENEECTLNELHEEEEEEDVPTDMEEEDLLTDVEEEDVRTDREEEEDITEELEEAVATKTKFTRGVSETASWISTVLLVTSDVSGSNVRSRSSLTISLPEGFLYLFLYFYACQVTNLSEELKVPGKFSELLWGGGRKTLIVESFAGEVEVPHVGVGARHGDGHVAEDDGACYLERVS